MAGNGTGERNPSRRRNSGEGSTPRRRTAGERRPVQKPGASLSDLPEREPALGRIREAASRGTLAHALLLTGDGNLTEAARYAAAAFQCTGGPVRPCGVCAACRKVLRDIHPDVVTVRDSEHKKIAVDVIRAVREDAWIRPNEGERKVYIFPDCTLLTEQDQNVLLKVVEEGPRYAAFLFCARSAAEVLQTIRSRCVELKLTPSASGAGTAPDRLPGSGEASPELPEAYRESGAELCRAVTEGGVALAEWAVRLESPREAKKRIPRDALEQVLAWSYGAFAAALLLPYRQSDGHRDGGYGTLPALLAGKLSRKQLVSALAILRRYREDCGYNIGVGHLLGALAAELAELRRQDRFP